MREPRIYTEQPLHSGRPLTLEAEPSRHLLKVLRLRPGDPLLLFNGDGREFHARLAAATKDSATVDLGEVGRNERPAVLDITLFIGVSRGERMDFAVQKAVELGATRIVPLFARRSVVQLKGERLERRLDHWRGVMIGACEQSGRCRLPLLETASDLSEAVAGNGQGLRLVLHHQGSAALPDLPPPKSGVDLLIGPEGGLEASEIALARDHGFIPVRLGPRIMRTETAPIAALAAIQTLWGDFRGG